MFTLKNTVLGEVIDVLHSPRTNRVYLVINPGTAIDGPHYLMPLLCPACGEPWHFIWNDTPEEMVHKLKESIEGYELVDVKYYPHSSVKNIAAAMEKLSAGSAPAELLIEDTAAHLGEDATFPVIGIRIELRVPSEQPASDELRSLDPAEVRELLDLDEKEDVDAAIQQLAEWMDSDGFEDYDVTDDFLLVLHPASILETIVVEPEPVDDDEEESEEEDSEEKTDEELDFEDMAEFDEISVIYPYELMLNLVEESGAAASPDILPGDEEE